MEALSQAAHRRQAVKVEEDVGAVRRAVARLAVGLAGIRSGEAELVTTELATNIVRHASPAGGYVLYRPAGAGIELLAVDRGPGMRRLGGAPPPRGGLGLGLASVERLASTFDLYSAPGEGTVVLARLGEPVRTGPFRWGAVNVPLDGEGESGDGWTVAIDGLLSAVVVDGLGHGPEAHAASMAAMSAFHGPLTDLGGYVRRAHEAMRHTRGGVIGVCSIDPDAARLTYAGVGNVTGRLLHLGASRGLLSREGTLGTRTQTPNVRVVEHRWEPGATLVLASDGLRSQWDPRAYPGLLGHDPAVVAATLHRDHGRGTDDATVLVVEDTR